MQTNNIFFRYVEHSRRRILLGVLSKSVIIIIAILLFWIKSSVQEKKCKPLPKSLYDLIKSQLSVENHHGYYRFFQCGQLFYHDIPSKKIHHTFFSRSAEEYAGKIKKIRGTGYIDFQLPDEVFKNVDYGYVSFPSKITCKKEQEQRKPAIYLSSMITADGFRPILIGYFVEHYAKLGILHENMLFTIQVSRLTDPDELKILITKLIEWNVYYDIYLGNWTSESLMFHQAHKLLFCTKKKDWIVVADSDEFHEYPGKNISFFVKEMTIKGYNFANGIFLDRISTDGSLVEIDDSMHLFEQFPLGCRVHLRLGLGTPKKVMIFRGALRINRGHHRLALCWFWQRRNQLYLSPWSTCPPQNAEKISPYPKRLNVHHFKWLKGQLESSEYKAQAYFGAPTGDSYVKVVDYLRKCEGLCIDDPKIKCRRTEVYSKLALE
mmetsp:Transcript_6795/g.20329  ORF Transcript_6795/g.20329 Transcript_6795/m.20329 type:complete len:435 (-) Transcript_6795:829-2133(-)